MYRIHISLITLLFVLLFCQFSVSVQTKTAPSAKDALSKISLSHREMLNLIYNMGKAYSTVNDYSAVFIKQELIKGKMRDEEIGKVYFRRPFNIYMEGLNGPYKGQRLIYRKGYNDGKLLINTRVLWRNRTFAIDPEGDLALRNNRHPVTEMGIGHLIEMLLEQARKA